MCQGHKHLFYFPSGRLNSLRWGGRSVSKVLAMKAWRPELDLQHPYEEPGEIIISPRTEEVETHSAGPTQ